MLVSFALFEIQSQTQKDGGRKQFKKLNPLSTIFNMKRTALPIIITVSLKCIFFKLPYTYCICCFRKEKTDQITTIQIATGQNYFRGLQLVQKNFRIGLNTFSPKNDNHLTTTSSKIKIQIIQKKYPNTLTLPILTDLRVFHPQPSIQGTHRTANQEQSEEIVSVVFNHYLYIPVDIRPDNPKPVASCQCYTAKDFSKVCVDKLLTFGFLTSLKLTWNGR